MDEPRKCKQDSPGYLTKQPPVHQLSKIRPRSVTDMAKSTKKVWIIVLPRSKKWRQKLKINQHARIPVARPR